MKYKLARTFFFPVLFASLISFSCASNNDSSTQCKFEPSTLPESAFYTCGIYDKEIFDLIHNYRKNLGLSTLWPDGSDILEASLANSKSMAQKGKLIDYKLPELEKYSETQKLIATNSANNAEEVFNIILKNRAYKSALENGKFKYAAVKGAMLRETKQWFYTIILCSY